MSITAKDCVSIQKMIDSKIILWGEVQRVAATSDRARYLIVAPQDTMAAARYTCVIKREEADAFFKRDSLEYVVGCRVPFVLIGYDEENGVVYCSRKRAQESIREAMREDFAAKKTFSGTVFGLLTYGAFVEVGGLVGLLKNTDFSTDYSAVSEYKKVGDPIKVRCKSIDNKGYINWAAPRKVKRNKPFKCDLATGNAVVGKVIGIGSFPSGDGIFVNVAEGVDALCSAPPTVDVTVGTRVAVFLTRVDPDKDPTKAPRCRGRILRVV